MRPFVEKVESSVKSGVVAQPGRKTLVLGRNGRGKSAIVNAIELAGTGAASDIMGRPLMARDADLFSLAPPGAEKVWAQARLSGGAGTAAWELTKGHRAVHVGPSIAFPLRDVRDAILGSPETARKWILSVGGSFEWSEVEALVPASLHKRLGSLVGGGDLAAIGAPTALVAALETARKRVRDANATAKAARSLPAPPRPPPTDQEVSAIEEIVRAWASRGDGEPVVDPVALIREERVKVEARITDLTNRAQAVETEQASLPPPVAGGEVRQAAILVIEALVHVQAHECAICGGATDPTKLAERAARGKAKIAEAMKTERRRTALEATHGVLVSELQAARRELSRILTEEARAEKRSTASTPSPAVPRAEAEATLRDMNELRAAWNASRASEERALSAEREANEYDALATALATALGKLVEKARESFRLRVQRFLPKSDLFGIDLLDGEREVLRIGLLRSSGDRMVLHPALSGAEWARVTAAIALATAPASGPCVICPEERAFDPETLSEVLVALDESVQGEDAPQVIITSPVPPTEIPGGWAIIKLEETGETKSQPAIIGDAASAPATPEEKTRRVPRRKAKDTELYVDGKGKRDVEEPAKAPPVVKNVWD